MTRSESNRKAIHTAVMMLVLVSIIAVVAWCFHCSLQPQTSTKQESYPTIYANEIVLVNQAGQPCIVLTANDTATIRMQNPSNPKNRLLLTLNQNQAMLTCTDGINCAEVTPLGASSVDRTPIVCGR